MTLDNHIKAVKLQEAIKEQFKIVQDLYKVSEEATRYNNKDHEMINLYYQKNFIVNRKDFLYFLKIQTIIAEEKLEDLNKEFDNL